ncbi:MAG: WYL domain-containing protein [Armatimonadetes bacterium]|nr:WYL domain-containing protein [Armatimonadota bacterium]
MSLTTSPTAGLACRDQDRLRRVTRLFHIATALQSGNSPSLAELSHICGCSTKTIQRDLSYLAELRVPFRYDGARRGYVLEGRLPFGILDLTLAEVTALSLGIAFLDAPQSPPTARALASGMAKILSALPQDVAEQALRARQHLLASPGTGRDYSRAPFYPLLRACRERVAVRMDYESLSTGRRVRPVEPYCIAWLSGFWMLVARDPTHDEVREFALDRIHACELTDRRFTIPADWSLVRYVAGCVRVLRGDPVAIRVRFLPAVAPLVRSMRWQFTHTIEDAADGSVVLSATVAGLEEITKEILRWGRHAEALAPEELRRRVALEAHAILSLYGDRPPDHPS